METCDVAIVGGGIGGAALAWQLAGRAPHLSIALYERETLPGAHSSGRNASLLLQNDPDPVNGPLALESRRFYMDPPAGLFGAAPLVQVGSLRLASGPGGLTRQARSLAVVRAFGLEVEEISPAEAARRFTLLDPARITGAVACPTDGILDIHTIVTGFLEGARRRGVRVEMGRAVHRLRVAGDRVIGVETSAGEVDAGLTIVAAGGWAGALGAAIGAPLPLRPTRRHLVVTAPLPAVSREWPFVWDVDTPFYARPESGGLLLCGCDEDDAPDCDETVKPEKLEMIAAKASALLPSIAGVGVIRTWAGLRTLTPDGRDLIGPDPRRPGLFWMAGLGGHGMCAGPALARITAGLITGDPTETREASPRLPERLLAAGSSPNPVWT